MQGKLDWKQRLFKDINAKQRRFNNMLGDNICCPVCWQQFGPETIESHLSIEHVPPTSSAKLIGEKSLVTLTCNRCNHTYGTNYQNDLKFFLIHRLWQSDQYEGGIPGEITIPGSRALKCNITWNSKGIKIIGVPKANNPAVVKEHESILNKLAETKSQDWKFRLDGNLGYRKANVWNAYFHAAYLIAYIRTGGMYAFSQAGEILRKYIHEKNSASLGACIIPSQVLGVKGMPWLAKIEEPIDLRCLWIKVAGNIAVLPYPDNTALSSFYQAWQQACNMTDFGLVPRDRIHFKVTFFTKGDMIEARKSLPSFLERCSPT